MAKKRWSQNSPSRYRDQQWAERWNDMLLQQQRDKPIAASQEWRPILSGRCKVCGITTDEVRLVKTSDPTYRVFLHHKCRDTWTASQDPRMADLPF